MGSKIKTAAEDTLSTLHSMTAAYMMQRLAAAQREEIQLVPSELSAIIKFLKDNGIECTREDMEEQFSNVLHLRPPSFNDLEAAN